MGKLLEADGVQGMANTELTCETALAVGRAAAMALAGTEGRRPKVVIGKDPRLSSDMLEAALVAGFCSAGADVQLLGVLSTPAVAYLVNLYGADAGVMISGAHHSFEYNGIRIFSGEGHDSPDILEEKIEGLILDGAATFPCPAGAGIGRVTSCKTAVDDYVRHLLSATDIDLRGMRLAVDCANGSASATARRLFPALGADCVFLNDQPDGINIHENSGSIQIEQLADFVKKLKYFAGIAFEGDGGCCLAVDEKGNLIDGDKIMAALAVDMKEKNELPGDAVVVSVLSNLGFFRFCEQHGVTPVSVKAGGRYVWEEMRRHGYALGGEQSGHILFSKYAATGDGQLAAIKLLSLCRERGQKLSRIGSMMERYPQVFINVRADAAQKARYAADTALAEEISRAGESLGRDGRVLVRVSGTEPFIRVMVEGRDFEEINRLAVEVGEKIKAGIGAP